MYEGECGNAMQLCEAGIQLERQSARVKDDSKTSLSCYGQLVSIHQIESRVNLVEIRLEISLV